ERLLRISRRLASMDQALPFRHCGILPHRGESTNRIRGAFGFCSCSQVRLGKRELFVEVALLVEFRRGKLLAFVTLANDAADNDE
ncbi:MAG: hypothetical protein ACRDRS_25000, partial [Pseudonocardiaceae bacterium]